MLRLGAVGDVVRTLPAASALRAAYPDAHITWIVEPASAELLRAQPWVDEVMVFPRPRLAERLAARQFGEALGEGRAFLRRLRGARFRMVVDFHSILKSGLLSLLSGAPVRVGYARPYGREFSWLFANARAEIVPERCSRFERNAALVSYLGFSRAGHPEPLRIPAPVRDEMTKALDADGRPVAIFHPGTSDGTPHKRWNPEGYAAVARSLAEEGVDVRVTAGPARDDRVLAEAIVEGAAGAARRAPETKSLLELAGLFAASRLYVGSDTGPMHVASLVGTPVVQLMGPTHPVENQPYPETLSRTVRVPVACSPCRRGCSAAVCMGVIGPEAVVEAARALLAAEPSPAAGAREVR